MRTGLRPRTGCDSRTCPGQLVSRTAALESRRHEESAGTGVSAEDLEQYESELELQLYREYKDVVGIFKYAVENERRFYLCNVVDLKVRTEGGDVYYEVSMADAWVWDMYRPARFVRNVRVLTFKDVNVEELDKPDLELPDNPRLP